MGGPGGYIVVDPAAAAHAQAAAIAAMARMQIGQAQVSAPAHMLVVVARV